MAQIPSNELIKAIQEATQAAIDEKAKSQLENGKEFILPKGGGAGVIPEEIWAMHKIEETK